MLRPFALLRVTLFACLLPATSIQAQVGSPAGPVLVERLQARRSAHGSSPAWF